MSHRTDKDHAIKRITEAMALLGQRGGRLATTDEEPAGLRLDLADVRAQLGRADDHLAAMHRDGQ